MLMQALGLHHAACGCPGTLGSGEADADAAATAAAAMVADSLVHNYHQMLRMGALSTERKLKVAYMLPHHHVTGGMKTLLRHMQLLRQRGHTVVAVHRALSAAIPPQSPSQQGHQQQTLISSRQGATHSPSSLSGLPSTAAGAQPTLAQPRALPPWSGIQVDEEVVLGPDEHLATAYPAVHTLDVIVCGMFQNVPELLVGLSGSRTAILYFEQGHEFLFGDPVRAQPSFGYAAVDRTFHMVMGLPVALACVSEPVQQVLQREFGRGKVLVVPNGVDTDAFCPLGAHGPETSQLPQGPTTWGALQQEQEIKSQQTESQGSHQVMVEAQAVPGSAQAMDTDLPGHQAGGVRYQQAHGVQAGQELPAVWTGVGLPPPTHVISALQVVPHDRCQPCLLLVGDPGLPLKGFDAALAVLQAVVQRLLQQQAPHLQHHQQQQGPQAAPPPHAAPTPQLPLLVTWVCQRMPGPELLESVQALQPYLALALYVQPDQAQLPALYRCHTLLLFTSRYEAWGMPVLEAMASGVAVVSTACSGVLSFVRPGNDCLLAAPGDVEGLAAHVLAVLQESQLHARLVQEGRRTACRYSLPAMAERLEEVLYSVVAAADGLRGLNSHPMCQATAQRACMAAIQASTAAATAAPTEEQPSATFG